MPVLVFSAPSGAGKSYVTRALAERYPGVFKALETTMTRRARPREILLPREAYFVSEGLFADMQRGAGKGAGNEFAWDVKVGENWYGTRRDVFYSAITNRAVWYVAAIVPSMLSVVHAKAAEVNLAHRVRYIQFDVPSDVLEERMRKRLTDPEELAARQTREVGWPALIREAAQSMSIVCLNGTRPVAELVEDIVTLLYPDPA